jgi:hypothetical protein
VPMPPAPPPTMTIFFIGLPVGTVCEAGDTPQFTAMQHEK